MNSITSRRSNLFVALLAVALLFGATLTVQAEMDKENKKAKNLGNKTITYTDAKPFFDLMGEAVSSAEDATLKAVKQSEELSKLDPSSPSSLVTYVSNLAKQAENQEKTKIIDRNFTNVNEQLSLCLGIKSMQVEEGPAVVTVCQDISTNVLSKLVVKSASGQTIAEYVLSKS